MVGYLKGQNTPMNSLAGDINVHSDCESDSTGPSDRALEENEESRAVLITGSFSAYVHFLAPPSR